MKRRPGYLRPKVAFTKKVVEKRPVPATRKGAYNRADSFESVEAMDEFDRSMDTYIEERRRMFVCGFAKFVHSKGFGAISPIKHEGRRESWQAVGRRLYGKELFDQTFRGLLSKKPDNSAGSPTSG